MTPWHQKSVKTILAQVRSSVAGLSKKEAAKRLLADGPNALKELPPVRPWQLLVGQFKNVIIWILIAASVISGALGELVDAITILLIVLLNAAIGFYQELSAAQSIAALLKLTAPQARVRREGHVTEVPATEIVVGDVLLLEAGDLVAADARLLKTASLKVIESALTGESVAVPKQPEILQQEDVPLAERENIVFQGTSVAAGTGQAVVVATEMQTELGHIAELLEETEINKDTPLQQKLDAFGRILIWAALGIVALLFVLGLLRGTKILELTLTSVSLAVAAVPEGLPTVVTVALSLGVLRMSRRNALVRKLAAVETLGSVSVICTDKTGTLTRGEMTVRELFVAGQRYEVTGGGYSPEGEIQLAGKRAQDSHTAPLLTLATNLLGCNSSHLSEEAGLWKTIGDPTEGALLVAGTKAGGNREALEKEQPKYRELPFDANRKRSAVIRTQADGSFRALVNGAPGQLLQRCTQLYTATGIVPLTDDMRDSLLEQVAVMAQAALRVLGSAYRDLASDTPESQLTPDGIERELVFVGLTGMVDPPRPEAKDAIARCHAAGIRVVMITGDNAHTANAIAQELGIATKSTAALTGTELDALTEEQLQQRTPTIAVYARVTAAHKLRIIHALRASGAIVAMTGDGVNDAPAIKHADIGIAMGKTGTEVTKQAADMIITDDNFATIVAAVEEGRGIYDNIRKTLEYLLAGNAGELLLMTACVIVGLPSPLLPIHLLWINLVTDGLPALCLAIDPIDSDVMKRPPRHPFEKIIDRSFLRTMLLNGFLTAGVTFTEYLYILRTETPEVARTHAFTVLVFAELLRSFGARSESKPLWEIPFFSNRNLVLVVTLSLGLQLWSQHNDFLSRFLKTESVSFLDSFFLLLIATIPLVILEVVKVIRSAK
nr:cation-translocating P-type ATPase [Armatimonas sp.]